MSANSSAFLDGLHAVRLSRHDLLRRGVASRLMLGQSFRRRSGLVLGRCAHLLAARASPPERHRGAALCPRQHQIAALRRALEDNDRAAFDRAAKDNGCKLVGPDIRLAVVAQPGAYDPDVEVRVAGDAPGSDGAGLPRGKVWTPKSMVRN